MQPQTVPEFCKTALKRILMSQGVKITPEQLREAINEYNLIADSWGADGSMIYTQQFYTFPLVAGQQTYSIGANTVVNGNTVVANFNTGTQPRPSYLESAQFEQTNVSPNIDTEMRIVDAAEWASIVIKQIYTDVGYVVYLDSAWPQANLNIFPAPSQSANIILTTWVQLNSNVGEGDFVSAPPGYARGLSLDLSIAMAPYHNKSGTPAIAQLASQLAKIKSDIGYINFRVGRVEYPFAAQSSKGLGGVYDIQSDQIR